MAREDKDMITSYIDFSNSALDPLLNALHCQRYDDSLKPEAHTRMEELVGVQGITNTPEQGLPPGFRFHPTDEELLSFYLASKVFESNCCGVAIAEVNLNKCEPWDLPEMAKLGEREWYLYNLRYNKYPTSLRTDRATRCGYWKATGKDKKIFRASGGGLLGIQKTLVFYKGRAPRGEKTSWVMHEYRLAATTVSLRPSLKAEWVMCKIFNKKVEKKDKPFKEQSYLPQAASSSTTNLLPSLPDQSCMPTMPESQTQALQQTFQYPLHIHRQEGDPRSLTRLHNQQSQIFPIPQSSPVLFDSLLFCEDPTIPQLRKTQAINSSNFQQPDNIFGTLRSMDNFKPSIDYYQHPATDAGVPYVST